MSATPMQAQVSRCEEVLIALRGVIRTTDMHSRQLVRSHRLTASSEVVQAMVNPEQPGPGLADAEAVADT